MAGLFDTNSFRIMEQGLQYISENSKIISNNIANIDTPDYKTKYLTFSGVLKEKVAENQKYSKELHLKTSIYVEEDTNGQPDGNNVDYEVQAALLKSNALRQEAVINQLDSEFSLLKTAMRR